MPPPMAAPGGFAPQQTQSLGPNFGAPSPVYNTGVRFCGSCGNPIANYAVQCAFCGAAVKANIPGQKSKIAAGLLGIFLGGFGVHSFYLGDNKKGAIQIAVTFVTCGLGAVWGLVEGIMILIGKVTVDAEGRPLGD